MAKKKQEEKETEESKEEVVEVTPEVVAAPRGSDEILALYKMVKRRLKEFSIGKDAPMPRVVFTSFVDDCEAVLEHEKRLTVNMWCCVEKGVMSMNRLETFTADVMRSLDAPFKIGKFTLSPVEMDFENRSGSGMRYSRVMMTLEPQLSESELKKHREEEQRKADEQTKALRKEAEKKAAEELEKARMDTADREALLRAEAEKQSAEQLELQKELEKLPQF